MIIPNIVVIYVHKLHLLLLNIILESYSIYDSELAFLEEKLPWYTLSLV
jgi:hypothetical protein